jgi:hypothetical protein
MDTYPLLEVELFERQKRVRVGGHVARPRTELREGRHTQITPAS